VSSGAVQPVELEGHGADLNAPVVTTGSRRPVEPSGRDGSGTGGQGAHLVSTGPRERHRPIIEASRGTTNPPTNHETKRQSRI
jgi:hypothetical protein